MKASTMTLCQYFMTISVKIEQHKILVFYPRYHSQHGVGFVLIFEQDLPIILTKIFCNHFRIGIKDKFSCFMMVLNYQSAV